MTYFAVFQEVLLDSYRTSRQDRKRLTDYHNPCHPPLPLRIALQKQETFIDEDSSDDENRAKVEFFRQNFHSKTYDTLKFGNANLVKNFFEISSLQM